MTILQRLEYMYMYVLKTACKGLHIFFAAQLPRHFVLKPNKSIIVLQGQSGEVTCEAEGPSVSMLKWEKQQDEQSYAAVPNSQVNITKDTKYVRATLKITNAQFVDTGSYKCTVSVPPNKSDYKLIKIDVKGMFVLYFFVKVTFTVSIIISAIHGPVASTSDSQCGCSQSMSCSDHLLDLFLVFPRSIPWLVIIQLVAPCQLGFSILLFSICIILLLIIECSALKLAGCPLLKQSKIQYYTVHQLCTCTVYH